MWVVKGWAESVKEWGSTGAIEEVEMVADSFRVRERERQGELLEKRERRDIRFFFVSAVCRNN